MRGRRIDGRVVYIDGLLAEGVDEAYVAWMNDPLIVRYLESRDTHHSRDDLVRYVRGMEDSPDDVMFGIYLLDGTHVGNAKIGGIDHHHGFADVGLIIGVASQWGRGYGTEAIELVTRYAFDVLRLNKVVAGIYANNIGSHKAFFKAGWREVGRLERHRLCDDAFVDQVIMEKVSETTG